VDDEARPPQEPAAGAWRAGPVGTGTAPPAADAGLEPPSAPPVERVRPRRRWPWVLAVLVLLAGVGVAAGVALDQRDVAAAWQDRALELEGQRDDAIGRGAALQDQLDEVASLLAVSERDVAQLEDRVRELADEKAQAEDTATTVQVERDVVLDVSQRIADATESLDRCIARLFELQSSSVEAFNRSAAGDEVDVAPLNAQAREVTDFCNDARSAAAAASTAADRLTAP
jgi:hypothetical protein